MIVAHRRAGQRIGNRSAPLRLRHQARLVEQFVTLQHELFVPRTAGQPESDLDAIFALAAQTRKVGGIALPMAADAAQ